MKLFKKVALAIAVCAMAIVAAAPAFAADESLIDTSATTTLTIHKSLVDSTSGLTAGNGEEQSGVTGDPVEDVVFNAYKIDTTGKAAPSDSFTYDINNSTLSSNGVTYTLGTPTAMTTGTDGTVTQTLDQGYYLVVEADATAAKVNGEAKTITGTCAPFIVRLPMTSASSDSWNYNVHVYPKNTSSAANKAADKTAVSVGESVTWTVDMNVPDGVENYGKFNFVDNLDSALDFTDGSVVVTDGTNTLSASGNYTVDCTNNKLVVTFTAAGRQAIKDYKKIYVSFSTTTNNGILNKAHYTVTNKAQFDLTNENGVDSSVVTNEESIHTGAILINKTKSDATGGDLSGVEFKIASSSENAAAGHYLRITTAGDILDYGDTGYDSAKDYTVTTATDGTAKFEGLADYAADASGNKSYNTYYLVETKTFSGYELLGSPVAAAFTAANSSVSTDYTITEAIQNTPKTSLPLTGGMGTVAFTIFGLVLMAAGIALALRNRKVSSK